MIEVKVKRLHPDARLPTYSHTGPAGDLAADLYSIEELVIAPQQVQGIRTGIALELPPGYGAIVEDRSGLALRGITTLAGVIDSGYRGELKVVIANVGSTRYTVKHGERIAQLRLVQRLEATFTEVAEIAASERMDKGFGSTGS